MRHRDRIVAEAERVFVDREKAARWLRQPNTALGGKSPLSLLDSEAESRKVEEALVRIDHGLYG